MTELKTYYITSQTILAKIIYFKNVLNIPMLTIFYIKILHINKHDNKTNNWK